jgi:hypothetical protein
MWVDRDTSNDFEGYKGFEPEEILNESVMCTFCGEVYDILMIQFEDNEGEYWCGCDEGCDPPEGWYSSER